MNKNIVFDMDGVLFDSERIYYRAWLEAGRKRSMPDVDTCVTHCVGRNGNDTRAYLRGIYGQDFPVDSLIEEIRSEFTNIVDAEGLPIKIGVHALLDWLTATGWNIALATSSGKNGTARNLSVSGLARYFSIIITGDMIQNGKPSPDIYLLACKKLGARPEESFAVEDSPNGVLSAHAAGLKVLLVPDILEPGEEIKALAFKTYPTLTEVKTYLESVINQHSMD